MFQEKIKPNGAIEIPLEVRRRLKWDIGDEINLLLNPGYVILKEREERKRYKKTKLIVDEVAGSVRITDPSIIDKIINETEFKE